MTPAINIFCEPSPRMEDLNAGALVIPDGALVDEFGIPILDENGNFIFGATVATITGAAYAFGALTLTGSLFTNAGGEAAWIMNVLFPPATSSAQSVFVSAGSVQIAALLDPGNYSVYYVNAAGQSNTFNFTI